MSRGFDCILGNPPFLNQLESGTALARQSAALIKVMFADARSRYTDASGLFLLLAERITASDGCYSLVQPQSVLAAAGSKGIRDALLEHGALRALWVSYEHVFSEAMVFTCAITIEKGAGRQGPLHRSSHATFTALAPIDLDNDQLQRVETWSHLMAEASGIPSVVPVTSGTIADLAEVTADFRDQFYGLSGFLIEDARLDVERGTPTFESCFPPIVTTGGIDLARCDWGVRPMRILGTKWDAPRIDRARMDREGELGPWITRRLAPKVLMATQTRVIETYADQAGRFVPSVPVLSVVPRNHNDVFLLAAALSAPPIVALAMTKYSGAALSVDAIKLSASQVAALPLPADHEAWIAAAASFEAAQHAPSEAQSLELLVEYGSMACAAFGLRGAQCAELMAWWTARIGAGAPA